MRLIRILGESDSQIKELLLKNWLISKLFIAQIEVSIPIRDNGIDIIVYKNPRKANKFIPVQIKSSQMMGFSLDKKYLKFENLKFIYAFNSTGNLYFKNGDVKFYVLNMEEYKTIIEKFIEGKSKSWDNSGKYYSKNIKKEILEFIKEKEVTADHHHWHKFLFED